MAVHHVPTGYHALTPYLAVRDAARAIEWYTTVLGAEEALRFPMPDGKIAHAELRIEGSWLMLADEMEGHIGPQTLGGSAVTLSLYVKDVDTVYHRALANGARAE